MLTLKKYVLLAIQTKQSLKNATELEDEAPTVSVNEVNKHEVIIQIISI